MQERKDSNHTLSAIGAILNLEDNMDQPKIERLLRLMQMLTSNVSYTIDDLSTKLDMSVATF